MDEHTISVCNQPTTSAEQPTRVTKSSTSLTRLLLPLHLFIGFFSSTAWVSQYKKGKTTTDLNEARDDGVWGWQWHQLDHMQTICTLLQTDNHTNTSSLNFYRPDALPDTQPTVSDTITEGRRRECQLCQVTLHDHIWHVSSRSSQACGKLD